ncbi:hypothetical protein [Cryobacterium psychrophilum]|uniref:Uncharacterized protein n=1 Tax=Cryobacterium psychrophilum TaxID=41988 RepID=A0A4Y8KPT2_9MICO|nr:hypothetical protein [Cryobacterium psychrophilum]TDW30919.1 hypothetical protein EDD25_2702 [Cryobacterium psychrophilum]TFD80794.1 hypothetical protein E3T53_03930 [Cryobacterium psychrophilum]
MELLFVSLGGTLLGLAARYLLPGRSTQGSVLVPALGTVVAAAAWVALTWLGWKWDAGAIWWVSFVASAVASAAIALLLARRRNQADLDMLHAGMNSGAPGSPRTH